MMTGQVRCGHDETVFRHFRGLDEEISQERRLLRARDLPVVENLTDLDALLARLRVSKTVVYGVDEIRLFNGDNHETARFRFPRAYIHTKEIELRVIRQNHKRRLQVIHALTDGNSTVATVSFIPGGVDHYRHTVGVLPQRWQEEVSKFCELLDNPVCRNSSLRHVHFETKLCTELDWSLNIERLLNSALQEISLPDLNEGWRELAAGLAKNRTLRVVTVPYDRENMNTLLQTPSSRRQGEPIRESWTRCNKTMKTLCISLPNDFMTGDNVQAEAKAMASMLYQVNSVSTFAIEYTPPERPPKLLEFANCLREALAVATNVRNLHLLVPFRSPELYDHILPMGITLSCLVLVLDLWSKTDLKAAQSMIRNSKELEIFGLRRQDPKRKLSFWKRSQSQEISSADIVELLEHDRFDEARRRTLSVRGRDQVDGAWDDRLLQRTNVFIELGAAGLALRNRRDEANRESERSTTPGLSSSYQTSPRVSLAGNYGSVCGGMVLSAGASTSGSSIYDGKKPFSEHGEVDSLIGEGPGSVDPAITEQRVHQQWQLQQLQRQQQQHPERQQGPPMHFSNFSFDELQKATRNFDPSAVIGRGGFGQVYKGKLATPDSGKREVAVKDLNLEAVSWQRVVKSFQTEVLTLGRLHHVNLVRLMGYCTHDRRHLLVYEFMRNLSLDCWIFRDGPKEFKLHWKMRVSIAVGVGRGLHYLHFECDPPIIHLDIKPQNILLDGKMVPKLADFGIAKLVVDTERNLATVTQAQGTKCYMAPEINRSNHVTPLSDVFSFGLLLIEILRGRRNTDMPQVDEDSHLTFPFWARKKFQTGQYLTAYEQLAAPLVSPLIPGYQEEEARRMLCIAIACINEEMVKRPDMRTVLLMLEDREPVPDPSQSKPTVSYDFRFYESNVR